MIPNRQIKSAVKTLDFGRFYIFLVNSELFPTLF